MLTKFVAVSSDQADRLFWLGRYVERVYSTLKLFNKSIDRMIETDSSYIEFCQQLSIPADRYQNALDFEKSYLFDQSNPDSIYSNLSRAYDNAIVLRNFITTESLGYIQMALNRLQRGHRDASAFLETQYVSDWLLAFWGSIEETIKDPSKRDLIKVGKYVERIDLALRLEKDNRTISIFFPRLKSRSRRVSALLNTDCYSEIETLIETVGSNDVSRRRALELINSLH